MLSNDGWLAFQDLVQDSRASASPQISASKTSAALMRPCLWAISFPSWYATQAHAVMPLYCDPPENTNTDFESALSVIRSNACFPRSLLKSLGHCAQYGASAASLQPGCSGRPRAVFRRSAPDSPRFCLFRKSSGELMPGQDRSPDGRSLVVSFSTLALSIFWA